jgi:hypothetical protein
MDASNAAGLGGRAVGTERDHHGSRVMTASVRRLKDMKVQQASPLRQAHDSRPKVPSDLPEPTVESPLYGRPDQIDTVSPGLLDESGAVQSIAVTSSWLPRLGAPA